MGCVPRGCTASPGTDERVVIAVCDAPQAAIPGSHAEHVGGTPVGDRLLVLDVNFRSHPTYVRYTAGLPPISDGTALSLLGSHGFPLHTPSASRRPDGGSVGVGVGFGVGLGVGLGVGFGVGAVVGFRRRIPRGSAVGRLVGSPGGLEVGPTTAGGSVPIRLGRPRGLHGRSMARRAGRRRREAGRRRVTASGSSKSVAASATSDSITGGSLRQRMRSVRRQGRGPWPRRMAAGAGRRPTPRRPRQRRPRARLPAAWRCWYEGEELDARRRWTPGRERASGLPWTRLPHERGAVGPAVMPRFLGSSRVMPRGLGTAQDRVRTDLVVAGAMRTRQPGTRTGSHWRAANHIP